MAVLAAVSSLTSMVAWVSSPTASSMAGVAVSALFEAPKTKSGSSFETPKSKLNCSLEKNAESRLLLEGLLVFLDLQGVHFLPLLRFVDCSDSSNKGSHSANMATFCLVSRETCSSAVSFLPSDGNSSSTTCGGMDVNSVIGWSLSNDTAEFVPNLTTG